MFCSQCQKEIADGSRFCYFCGASMASQNAQAPPPGPAPASSFAPPYTPPLTSGAPRRLTRSVRDRRIGGVCAGLAEHLDLDVSLVRVLTVVLLIPYGVALWAYIVAWIIVPEAQPGTEPAPLPPARRLHRSLHNRKIGGVCGGVAEYFDIDPSIIRILWAASVVCFGIGFFSYVILWFILPIAEPTPVGVQPAA